jgi:hypothetical protein
MVHTQDTLETLKAKAEKWDALESKVSEFYLNTEGEYDEENPVRKGDLGDIGEVAAIAFGWL